MKYGLLLLLILALITACATQEICGSDNQSEMVARFKTTGDLGTTDTILSQVTVYGIRPDKPDSLIVSDDDISRLVVPLNPNASFSTFVLEVNGQSDTLRINHRTEYYLISYTCGFAALFTLENLEHTSGLIKETEIIQPVVDAELEQNEEHIWIYF
ncbi:MAG: DUF6452 family protein [Bacteroidales bacterium]